MVNSYPSMLTEPTLGSVEVFSMTVSETVLDPVKLFSGTMMKSLVVVGFHEQESKLVLTRKSIIPPELSTKLLYGARDDT